MADECRDSIASNLNRMLQFCFLIIRIPEELFKFALKYFESLSNAFNVHSNG